MRLDGRRSEVLPATYRRVAVNGNRNPDYCSRSFHNMKTRPKPAYVVCDLIPFLETREDALRVANHYELGGNVGSVNGGMSFEQVEALRCYYQGSPIRERYALQITTTSEVMQTPSTAVQCLNEPKPSGSTMRVCPFERDPLVRCL
jgi:hypothetical protein